MTQVGVQRERRNGTPPFADANQLAVDAPCRKPVLAEVGRPRQPRNADDDQYIGDCTGNGILMNERLGLVHSRRGGFSSS